MCKVHVRDRPDLFDPEGKFDQARVKIDIYEIRSIYIDDNADDSADDYAVNENHSMSWTVQVWHTFCCANYKFIKYKVYY